MEKDLPVSVWKQWDIIEKIGEGSFGTVYKAKKEENGHVFLSAIKIIPIPQNRAEWESVLLETKSEKSTKEYFWNLVEECLQEISTMERFRGCSYIVSVEDFSVVEFLDENGWEIHIRMEFLESFNNYQIEHNLTKDDIVNLGKDIARALTYCRKVGIIHRDIKPENIFVSRLGSFKLGDFGIAKEMEKVVGAMSKGGTYAYMAPEVYKGQGYDSSSDIYSLGIVLYKLLNKNRLPFVPLNKQLITYRDKQDALERRMNNEKMSLPCDCDKALGEIILRACAFNPFDRYKTSDDFLQALDNYTNKLNYIFLPINEEDKKELGNNGNKENTVRRIKPVTKKRIRPSAWTLIASILIIITVIITFVYIKGVVINEIAVNDNERTIRDIDKDTDDEIQQDSFTDQLGNIRKRATEIVNNISHYARKGYEGNILEYYDSDAKEPKKILVYPSNSVDGNYEEYYFWHGKPFFVYVWNGNDKELYYYKPNGNLLRYTDKSGKVYDEPFSKDERFYQKAKQYWENGLAYAESDLPFQPGHEKNG